MSTDARSLLTPVEYLARERAAEFKSEFFDGETFAMAGASREHNLIVANLVGEFRAALKNSNCEVYASDMRVKIPATGLYTYPDVSIACIEPEFEDAELDTLLNPTVVIEVLSKSTEAYDRGTKASHYRKLDSLQAYLLVAQSRCSVESYTRANDGNWILEECADLKCELRLDSPEVAVPLEEIYRGIELAKLNLRSN